MSVRTIFTRSLWTSSGGIPIPVTALLLQRIINGEILEEVTKSILMEKMKSIVTVTFVYIALPRLDRLIFVYFVFELFFYRHPPSPHSGDTSRILQRKYLPLT